MTMVWEHSFIRRVIGLLIAWLSASGTAHLYYRVEKGIVGWLRGSTVCTFLARPGRSVTKWEDSILCRVLEWLVNVIPSVLHRLYRCFQAVWEGSLAFRALAWLGENIPILLSWFFLLMMVCPSEYWNNMYSFVFGAVCIVLCYGAAMRQTMSRLHAKAFNPYLWVFFFMLCVGVVEAGNRTVSIRYLTYFISAVLVAILVASTVTDRHQLKRLAAFGAAGLPVATVYSLYQRFVEEIQNTSSTVDMELNADMPGRVFSFFENPNTFAQVLVMMIGMALGLLFASRSLWGKLFSLFAVVCGVVSIAMTYSRASWIGLVVAIFVFVLLAERRLIPVLILAAIALLPFLPASILNRILTIFNPSDSSTSSRLPIYSVGLRIWKLSPLTGIGLGSELSAKIAHTSGWYYEIFKFPHYHNIFLQLAVELGLIGTISYTAGFISACKESVRALFSANCNREVRVLTIGCLSGLVGVMVCGLADYFWHYPRVMVIFWLIFGMMLCGTKLAKQNTD